MAYAFDYHLAKNKDGLRDKIEKDEKLDIQEYRFYRKRIYALTKWFMQNRHREEYSQKVPDGVSYPVSQDVFDAFDSWANVVINTLKSDDRLDTIKIDIEGQCGYSHDDVSYSIEDINSVLVPKQTIPIDKMLGVHREKGKTREKVAYPKIKEIQLRDHKYRNKRIPSLNLTNKYEDNTKQKK